MKTPTHENRGNGETETRGAEVISTRDCLLNLRSLTCACGAWKATRRSMCRAHYFALPEGMRDALRARCGEGYEEAYTRALQFHGIDRKAGGKR